MDIFASSFSEGVEPGGLREKSEIKPLVCYLIKHIDKPLTKTRLNEILQQEALANYFETNQAISELVKGGKIQLVFRDGEEVLLLDPATELSLSEIERSIPYTVREKALSAAIRMFARDRNERETDVVLEKTENGMNVTFTIMEGETLLFRLTVFAADDGQAQKIIDNFMEKSADIYGNVIASLIIV